MLDLDKVIVELGTNLLSESLDTLWTDPGRWRNRRLPQDGDTVVFPKTGLPYIEAVERNDGQNTESPKRRIPDPA
jgi:hypothetical protein